MIAHRDRKGISRRSVWFTLLAFPPILALVTAAAMLIHEVGHGLTAKLLGGEFNSIYVFPGIQVWPHFGQPFEGPWGNIIARTYYQYGPTWQTDGWKNGFVALMGSGTNLLLAALALGALRVFKPRGLLKLFLVAESLMFFDIVCYTFLPLFGLRHFFFIGGKVSEPLDGAIQMGISPQVFLISIFAVFVLFIVGLIKLLAAPRSPLPVRHAPHAPSSP